jgi:hypothetical protein
MKLGQDGFIVRDAEGHALAYVYFEDEPGRREVEPSEMTQVMASRLFRH